MAHYYRTLLLVCFLFLSACNGDQKQPLEGQPISENPLLPLSTTNDHADPTEEIFTEEDRNNQLKDPVPVNPEENNMSDNAESDMVKEGIDDVPPSPGYGIPQAKPSQQETIDTGESNDFQLPLADFRERWNAISNEQGMDLKIPALEKVEQGNFKATLKNKINLYLRAPSDRIETIEVVTSDIEREQQLNMLAAWSQVIYMLEQNADPHQIDQVFSEFNIGPNADLSGVQEKTIVRGNLRYTVKPLGTGYFFEAAYTNS